jgi:hypothetical protein
MRIVKSEEDKGLALERKKTTILKLTFNLVATLPIQVKNTNVLHIL